MNRRRQQRRHAAKVATVATAVVVACYLALPVALSVFVVHRLTAEADGRLTDRLVDAGQPTTGSGAHPSPAPADSTGGDIDDVPIIVWKVGRDGAIHPLTAGAPALPRRQWSDVLVTIAMGTVPFRFDAARSGPGWAVAGQDVAEISRVRSTLMGPEVVFGALLAVATFAGALVVGLRVSAPLDLVRRRQAEFTADASHELRTPLSVVEAEVELALMRRRSPAEYEGVLRRVAGEGRRLRRIVDDLLWLARADSGSPERPDVQPVDVAAIAAACTDRFAAVARRQGVALSYRPDGNGPGTVPASPEWVERLCGVLIDNACKYAGAGGAAVVTVRTSGNRVTLRVDDSGPGIPVDERAAVFDRFHRAADDAGGAGLGLAIADSVVRMTGGTWSVGESALGGARLEVSWRRVEDRAGPRAGSARRPVAGPDGAGGAGGGATAGAGVATAIDRVRR